MPRSIRLGSLRLGTRRGKDQIDKSVDEPTPTHGLSVWKRRLRLLLLGIGLVGGALGLVIYGPALRYAGMSQLTIVEVVRQPDGVRYSFQVPELADPALLQLGPAPTPIGVSFRAQTENFIAIGLFESLGEPTLLVLNKRTRKIKELPLPDAQIAHAAVADRRRQDVLWIATSDAPALYRYDGSSKQLTHVCDFPLLSKHSYLFALHQAEDGSLFVGSHPEARCLRVRFNNGSTSIEEIQTPHEARGDRQYLRGIYSNDKSLLLDYGSPGRLVRYHPDSQAVEILIDSSSPFLGSETYAEAVVFLDGDSSHWFDRRGSAIVEPPTDRTPLAPQVRLDGLEGKISLGEEEVPFSLFPRHGGMRITALDAQPDGLVYGGTYWNSWLFHVDVQGQRVEGQGALPGASGEFFTTDWVAGRLAIPNYQGVLYSFDPQSGQFNSEATVPGGHFGTATAIDSRGRMIYSTHPNYGSPGGILVRYTPKVGVEVWDTIDGGLSIGALALIEDRLLAGSTQSVGMGNSSLAPGTDICQVQELDFDRREVIGRVQLGEKADDVVGLLSLGENRALAATSRSMFLIETGSSGL